MKFNEAQEQAIRHIDGPCLVLAGPGSGKTAVITDRTRYLIEEAGIHPANILVVTFTKAAAMEMQERFRTKMQGANVPCTFGTFHSIFSGYFAVPMVIQVIRSCQKKKNEKSSRNWFRRWSWSMKMRKSLFRI